jgi:hypothetical protein
MINGDTSATLEDIKGVRALESQNVKYLRLEDTTSVQYISLEEYDEMRYERYIQKSYIDTDPHFDQKVENIRKFMARRNAPLAEQAEFCVLMANKFDLDYRLVPAISIIESSGGKYLYRPYNAWGWGGSRGFTFESWEDSIYTVTRGISRGYKDRGAVTPQQMAPTYNPHTPNEWGAKVASTMEQIGPPL